MSRRGNGLSANAYAALTDLAPQLADAMLDMLRDAGVAAYATPAPGGGGANITPHRLTGPTDRLLVDAAATDRAQRILADHLPRLRSEYEALGAKGAVDLSEAERAYEDAAWAELIARFDTPGETAAMWPERENLDPAPARDDGGPADAEDEVPVTTSMRVIRPVDGEEGQRPDGEDHYVPPPPPPLPRTDGVTKAAWLALFGGPAYLLVVSVLGWEVPGWAAFAAVTAFVGGFMTLVLRMGDGPSRDSGPDDGAVV